MKQINEQLETHEHTYYFSITSSIKGKRAIKRPKEILHEPELTTQMALNYDISVDKNIIYQNEAKPEEIRKKL